MSDWLHNLPVVWMALIIFGSTYLVAAALYVLVATLAAGERARAFRAISPGMLPVLGVIFGLFVAFMAAQVWGDSDRANAAVDYEASALRSVVILAASFPGEPEAQLRALVRGCIKDAATQEWPMMARQTASLSITPRSLAEVLQLTLALTAGNPGQQIAQREMATALENSAGAGMRYRKQELRAIASRRILQTIKKGAWQLKRNCWRRFSPAPCSRN